MSALSLYAKVALLAKVMLNNSEPPSNTFYTNSTTWHCNQYNSDE